MRYLGFDVSSSVIGWNFIEVESGIINPKTIKCGHIKPPKKKEEIENLYDLGEIINEEFKKYKRKSDLLICIEESPRFISGGKGFGSTAGTIIKLSIYTRTTALKLFELFKMEPTFYAVATIRASIRKLVNRKDVKKEDIPECVESIIRKSSGTEWNFPYLLNKFDKPKKENNDVADSFAVSLTHAYKNNDLILER